jgi:ribosomal protein S18 acetylase RimI-like enzyme
VKSVSYTVELSCPSLEEFCLLREKVGWGKVNADLANTSLNNSLFHVVIRQEGLLVGMGRVIGDGGLFFYIQDVVVDPDFQRQGIGALIMDNIEMYLAGAAKKVRRSDCSQPKVKNLFMLVTDILVGRIKC